MNEMRDEVREYVDDELIELLESENGMRYLNQLSKITQLQVVGELMEELPEELQEMVAGEFTDD